MWREFQAVYCQVFIRCPAWYFILTILPYLTIIHLGAIVFYRHIVTSNNILVFSLQSCVRTLWESSSIWKIVSYQLFLDISCGQSWTRVSLNWITILHFALWLNSSEATVQSYPEQNSDINNYIQCNVTQTPILNNKQ